jgi:hypothetical protein
MRCDCCQTEDAKDFDMTVEQRRACHRLGQRFLCVGCQEEHDEVLREIATEEEGVQED